VTRGDAHNCMVCARSLAVLVLAMPAGRIGQVRCCCLTGYAPESLLVRLLTWSGRGGVFNGREMAGNRPAPAEQKVRC